MENILTINTNEESERIDRIDNFIRIMCEIILQNENELQDIAS